MMGSLGALGVGLSIVFGGFVLLLLAEVYYIVYRSNHRRPAKTAGANTNDDDEEFAREAALVGSFGGYTAAPDDDGETNSFPDKDYYNNNNNAVLFTIAEETKEDLLMIDSDLSPSSTITTPTKTPPAVAVKWPLAPPPAHLYAIGVIHPTAFSSPAFSAGCDDRFAGTATATAHPHSGRRTFAALLREPPVPVPAELLPSLQRESPSPEREYSGRSCSSSDSSWSFSPSASPTAFVTAPSTPSAAD